MGPPGTFDFLPDRRESADLLDTLSGDPFDQKTHERIAFHPVEKTDGDSRN